MEIASGEGERRAQRGYVPQYELAAKVIYEALASGRLRWIGVADRGAASFDDIVLGFADKIVAHQVKTSRDPATFSIRTLLLGADDLLGRILKARRSLTEESPEVIIETIYVCDDYPRSDDNIGSSDTGITSAAYLRAHEAHRISWSITDWRNSIYGSFISEVQKKSGLDDVGFESVWRNAQFMTGRQSRALGFDSPTAGDRKRIADISALLPRLVADVADQDRWQISEVLDRLNWRDPFGTRHAHIFPVDALYESNATTQDQLSKSLSAITNGYISLVGPPGSGKSTQLAAGLLPTPRAQIIRYLAFVPGKGQGLGRGEAFDFLHDLIKQFKQQGLGNKIIPGSELVELREQLHSTLAEASARFHKETIKTIIVVDGLDHVPREERPQHSFLRELPLPCNVPDGVVIVLGTQRLQLTDIPASVVDQASECGRHISIAPLTRDAVNRLAQLAGVPTDVDRARLWARTEGHPLSVRYIIDGLLHARTADERENWLTNGPAYGGDVDVFYKRAWHDLEVNDQARKGMAYLAIADGPISPASLDLVIGTEATDAVWKAAGHLLRRNRDGGWSLFHNSFRLFLVALTSLRHGVPDEEQVRRRYLELADMARLAGPNDGQRWMELRYCARAFDHRKVAALATPDTFRKQFIDGRNPGEIREDILLSFRAAKSLRNPQLVLDLILASHELTMRTEALGDEVFSASLALGDLKAAKGIVNTEAGSLTAGIGFDLIEAYLANGYLEEAREFFEALEPIDILLGSKELRSHPDEDGLKKWAEQALAFREPKQILSSLARLNMPDDGFGNQSKPEEYRTTLKLFAARGQLDRNPDFSIQDLMSSLELCAENLSIILYFGAKAAYQVGSDLLALERLEANAKISEDLYPSFRRESARMAIELGNLDLARSFMIGVRPPALELENDRYDDDGVRRASRQVILHASLNTRLGLPFEAGKTLKSVLLQVYQNRLETLGRILGDGLSAHKQEVDPLREFGEFLDFLQRAEGEGPHDFERGRITRTMTDAIIAMVDASASFGRDMLRAFSELMDARLETNPVRLGITSVRRAYATAMFRYDRDVESALKRIAYEPGLEGTPADHFSEAALTAQVMVSIGLPDNARRVLEQMHSDGVGYQRPAKKDPQYLLWEDFFQRANHEDPANRPERVKFFGRLLGGMANTEGEGAANRLTTIFLEEAVQTGSMLAASAADLLEECDLSTWADTVGAFATGLSKGTPDLTEVSAAIFGRLSIPFNSEVDKDQLADLIRKAPAGQIASVVRILVTALETDAPLDCRILAVEKVIETAAERGIKYGTDSLQRWRAELPAPRSGNSPEDPFFNLRTLDEVANLLESTRESSNRYGARSAFRKAAPHCKYSLAKSLFDKEEELNTDERVIETMAQLAIANRKQDDAEALLSSLRGLADARGSWGEYFSGQAKRRYFQLRVDLGHKQAREDAFDAFVEDLGNGRVSPEYLLPELGLLFELISPTITWAQAWNTLASHLAQFREYKRGNEMALRKDIPSGPEQSVADILFRAFETTSVPLTRMARSSAIEIANYHNGVSVIEALLTRLWRRGGHSALEASQIAWECRSVALLKGAIERLIPAMAESDDIAIQRTAMALAHKWNLGVSGKLGDLPEIYSLTLPHDANSETFDPPSGMSLSSAGLYSEDLLSWTWVLQLPLRIASSASGLDLLNIRHRAAQLMSRAGGTDEFGTEAVERQMAKLRRLSLHTSYRKLMNSTAFQAMREVVGELVAAESIDPRAVPVLSLRSGGFSPIVRSKSPTIRPVGIPAPDLPEIFGSPSKTNWTEGVDADLVRPKVKGFLVLAATATHKQRLRDETWRIEQYFGPATKFGGKDLCHHVQHLPEVVLTNVIEVRFDVPSIGGVARPEPDMPGSIDWETFMLCPVIASRLGWKPVAGDAFTFRNAEQEVVAFTMHWRDGGIDSREGDTSKHRYGFALLIREDQLPIFSPFLAEEYEVRAWRRFKKSQEDEETIRSAYRRVAPPSFSTSLSAI